jgi:hypothetical protein
VRHPVQVHLLNLKAVLRNLLRKELYVLIGLQLWEFNQLSEPA